MDYLLQLFKAVANERRLKILEILLDKRKLSIEGIAGELKIPFATVCRNLKTLERTYLVNSERKSGRVFYYLNRPKDHIYNKFIINLVRLRRKKKKIKHIK